MTEMTVEQTIRLTALGLALEHDSVHVDQLPILSTPAAIVTNAKVFETYLRSGGLDTVAGT